MGVLSKEGGGEMGYKSADYECWKCKRKTIVYTWSGHSMFFDKTPPRGKPDTIRWVYSHTAECQYWANTCKHCGALIGDFYLYCEPDGPFFGEEGSDSEEASARAGGPGGGVDNGGPL